MLSMIHDPQHMFDFAARRNPRKWDHASRSRSSAASSPWICLTGHRRCLEYGNQASVTCSFWFGMSRPLMQGSRDLLTWSHIFGLCPKLFCHTANKLRMLSSIFMHKFIASCEIWPGGQIKVWYVGLMPTNTQNQCCWTNTEWDGWLLFLLCTAR